MSGLQPSVTELSAYLGLGLGWDMAAPLAL
jgi:hypothetical protein